MIIYLMSFLLVIAVFSMFVVPVIATCHLYYAEKRVAFFKFTSFKREIGESALENKLIKICFMFESVSKVCVFVFVVLMVIRILTR